MADTVRTRAVPSLYWFYRAPLAVLALLIMLFPLFFGGFNDSTIFLVEIFGFLAIGVFAVCGFGAKQGIALGLRRLPLELLVVTCLFLLLVAIQLMPFPSWALSILSPHAAKAYSAVGATIGAISLERVTTLSALVWAGALAAIAFWLMAIPLERTIIRPWFAWRDHSRSEKILFEEAGETDLIVDLLHMLVILVGTVCSVIALLHWALEVDWSFWSAGEPTHGRLRSRAHWPFRNPDHLALLLEVAIILTGARILRLSQLMSLRMGGFTGANLRRKILDSPERLGKVISLSIVLVIMLITNILAQSRAGNVLVVLGLFLLWWVYVRYPVRPKNLETDSPQESEDQLRKTTVLSRLKPLRLPLMFIILLVAFVVFLGETAQELAIRRIEQGLEAGYDEARRLMVEASLPVLARFSLFGVGLGCWHLAVTQHISPRLATYEMDFAHNDLLQLMCEVGLLGTALWIWGAFKIGSRALTLWHSSILPTQRMQFVGAVTAVLLPLVHSFVDFPFHVPAIALIIVVMIALLVRLLDFYDEGEPPSETATVNSKQVSVYEG